MTSKSHRIRILHCMETIGSGGVEQRRLLLARRLPRERFESAILCTQAIGALPPLLADEGWSIHELGKPKSILDAAWYRRATRYARDYRPDIIHGAVYEGVALANVIGLFCGKARIISEETSDPANRRAGGHALLRLFLTGSDRVVGVSGFVEQYLANKLCVSKKKLRCIPNGVIDPGPVDPDVVERERRRLGLNQSDLVIGTVGRIFDSHKRFSDLLLALVKIRSRFPNAKLMIVGDGPDRDMLVRIAAESGISNAVIFAGYQAETRPFYELMDVFALASAREAFGLVLVEAMYAGLPVVATSVGGIPHVVSADETGLLVDAHRPDELAKALSLLLSDWRRRHQMGEAGRDRARRHFSDERYAREVTALYDELMA